ncbi:MAG: aminopeptidase [Phycisphaeraceae bacterium]|nr:aminopeptidase [Phycisphaerales bacterium]MCB9861235.1 aminopeptidase [Phycisphaeraceae bacterium]
MHDPRLDKLADVLVGYATKVKPGQIVNIVSDPVAMPLIQATYKRVLESGAHPVWSPRAQDLDELMVAHGNTDQLGFVSPLDMHRIETVDVVISFWAENNTRYLTQYDHTKLTAMQASRKAFLKRFMQREAEGSLTIVGTQYPTQASAQDAEMSLIQYEDFVYRAGLLHLDDPAAAWTKIEQRQQAVCDFLNSKSEVRFRAPASHGHDGTDLTVGVVGSTWINCEGTGNFPDGEVFAGPKNANGHVNFTYPAVYRGTEVEGVRLVFKDGRVIDASAKKNEAFLIAQLDQDQGARNMGEIAIGTNYSIQRFTRNTLFDEKIGGTFHMAVGAGYPESGNTNESALHWDMVCDLRKDAGGGTIEADGEVFFRDGRFLNAAWPNPA